jgi:hypothetical protein
VALEAGRRGSGAAGGAAGGWGRATLVAHRAAAGVQGIAAGGTGTKGVGGRRKKPQRLSPSSTPRSVASS